MKRVILSNRDDVLRRKKAYEDAVARRDAAAETASRAYQEAEDAVTSPVKTELEYNLGKFSNLSFDVHVGRGYGFRNPGLRIQISCNEDRKFNDDSALSWSYEAKLDREGNLQLESSSWSGLKATTPAQLQSLRQTVSALEYLQSLDWERLVAKELPKYSDYSPEPVDVPEHEDWDAQLLAADLEEYIGKPVLIKVSGWSESGPGNFSRGYIQILKDSGSQFTVNIVPAYRVEHADNVLETVNKYAYTARVRKSNIRPITENGELITVAY